MWEFCLVFLGWSGLFFGFVVIFIGDICMARDKAKDDLLFNCSQEHELKYVSGLYEGVEELIVYNFLVNSCQNGSIKNFTHLQVYSLIQQHYGYPIPVSV
jgi:hypothetical protein